MSLFRSVARTFIASAFVVAGTTAVRHPGPLAARAQPVVDVLTRATRRPPLNATALVRGTAYTQLAAAALFASGRLPRLSAAVLATTMPGATAIAHPFWNETDPLAKRRERIQFAKNLAITGGLLLSMRDPDPGTPWFSQQSSAAGTEHA